VVDFAACLWYYIDGNKTKIDLCFSKYRVDMAKKLVLQVFSAISAILIYKIFLKITFKK